MKLKRVVPSLLLILYVAVTALSFSQQSDERVEAVLPAGDWTLTHPVISQLGLADAPARIISNTGDAATGGTITKVVLRNNSAKTISAVKFNWYLFREDAPKKILKKGETPLLGVGSFAADSTRAVEYPIVTFANIYQPFTKNGKLYGKFVIEVAVSEIQYADGTRWRRSR